jgi:hypothetical protein
VGGQSGVRGQRAVLNAGVAQRNDLANARVAITMIKSVVTMAATVTEKL